MSYDPSTNKIDNAAVLGLLGTPNSLAYKVHEIEKHLHNTERWFGKSADQSGINPWAKSWSDTGMPTAYQAISGTATFGSDANDEALIWGVNDTLVVAGVTMTKLDMHRIFITNASVTTVYGFRIVWGSGTMADAIAAGQYGGIPIIADAAQGGGISIVLDIMMPRINIGTDKIWIQCKNATNNATIDFYVGIHGYQG